jgi:hypothetical protein
MSSRPPSIPNRPTNASLAAVPIGSLVAGGPGNLLHDDDAPLPLLMDRPLTLSARPPDSTGLPSQLLSALVQSSASVPLPWQRLALPQHVVLQQLVDSVLIPQLLARSRPAQERTNGSPVLSDARLSSLARALVAADPACALGLLDTMQAEAGALHLVCATVSEPAARCLGDMWAADDCSDVEVTVGLGRLQQAFRRLCAATQQPPAWLAQRRVVLVAPQPGEPHLLGAVLDAEMLWRAGCDVRCEFPADDAALDALVAGTWFDAVDLTLSAVYRRPHWQARMAATVAAMRHASRNPALAVVVGGRTFHDPVPAGDEPVHVGADAECGSAAQIVQALGRALLPH